MRKYEVKKMGNGREYLTFQEKNQKGETIMIELVKSASPKEKNQSMAYLWKKSGYTDRILETWWSVRTYVTTENGECLGKYNPQEVFSREKKRLILNFDWMFEATEENKNKLIAEIERLAFAE